MNVSLHSARTLAGTLALCLVASCTNTGGIDSGEDSGAVNGVAPTVLVTVPSDGAVDEPLNLSVSVAFSELMDPLSLTSSTFVVQSGTPPVAVEGTVIYDTTTTSFWPSAHLEPSTEYTAVLSTEILSDAGVALEQEYQWTFSTGTELEQGAPVPLGMAGSFAILAKAAVSSVPASAITGDVGVSPAAATYITGFSLSADATNVFATSPQVTGKVYASDYATPTPANLTSAISHMERAFVDAAGRAPSVTELGAGDIGGLTLEPGVYKWGTGLLIPTDVTLNGSATDVWIFQIAQNLTLSSGAAVKLTGGAVADNVFWQVAGSVDVGTTAHVEGNVITQTSLTLRTGASVNGRLLAQTAVDVDGATVTLP